MGQHSEEHMTFTFPATRHPVEILRATLATLTAHQGDTATAAPFPNHSWQDRTASHRTK